MEHDVFISYSMKNKTTADKICHVLEQNNLKCWIAPRNITSGKNYSQEIIEGIESAKSVVLVYSHYSLESELVQNETNVAFSNNIPILSFVIEDILPDEDMDYYLKITQWLPAYPDPEDALETLVLDTRNLCNENEQQALIVDLTNFKAEDISSAKKDYISLILLFTPIYWTSFLYMGVTGDKKLWKLMGLIYLIPSILCAASYLQILPAFMIFLSVFIIFWAIAIIHGLFIRNDFLTRKYVLKFTSSDDNLFEYLYEEYINE